MIPTEGKIVLIHMQFDGLEHISSLHAQMKNIYNPLKYVMAGLPLVTTQNLLKLKGGNPSVQETDESVICSRGRADAHFDNNSISKCYHISRMQKAGLNGEVLTDDEFMKKFLNRRQFRDIVCSDAIMLLVWKLW